MLVAGMRGVGRGVEIDDRALTRLVLLGVPLLAIPWILGQLGSGELRPVFVEHAFVASLTFVSAGFMAAGLARLQEIGRETGVDWRTNRSWLGTVLGVLAIVLAVGVPTAVPARAARSVPSPAGSSVPFFSLLGYVLLARGLRGSHPVGRALRGAPPDRDRAARTAEPAGARPAAGGTGIHHRPAPGTDHHGGHPVDRRHPPGGDRAPNLGTTTGSWPTAWRDRGAVVQHSAGIVPAPAAADRRTRSARPARSPDRRGQCLPCHPRRPGGARPGPRAARCRVASRPRRSRRAGRPRRAPGRLRARAVRGPPPDRCRASARAGPVATHPPSASRGALDSSR